MDWAVAERSGNLVLAGSSGECGGTTFESRDPPTLELLAREGIHTGYVFFMPREEVAPRYREFVSRWQQAGHAYKPNTSYWTLVYVDETNEIAIERAKPHFVVFVGSPTTVARNIQRAAEEGMFNTVLCELNFGALSQGDLERSIRLFGTEVIPARRAVEPF